MGEGFNPIGVTDLRIYKKRWKSRIPERRNRERQRDRSNLGGALAPPMPWRPRTRGETLLPSREEVKEEEDEGPSSSSPRSTPTPPPYSLTSPSPYPIYIQRSTLPQPAVPSTWTWCFMLHIIIQWCVAILWCLSRFSLSYRWLMNCYDWFNLLVVMLLSFGAHHMIARVDHTLGLVVCW